MAQSAFIIILGERVMKPTYKYFVGMRTISRSPDIEISEEQFENAKQASESLLRALSIEEKFNVLFENYLEYEGSPKLSTTAKSIPLACAERVNIMPLIRFFIIDCDVLLEYSLPVCRVPLFDVPIKYMSSL
jgi:hypothetical protein